MPGDKTKPGGQEVAVQAVGDGCGCRMDLPDESALGAADRWPGANTTLPIVDNAH